MNRPYGPWATQISTGQNPQLSAFWRRRMGMLASVSKTNPTFSRRSIALLLAAAGFVILLPTLRPAPADAQQHAAGEAKPATKPQAAPPDVPAEPVEREAAPEMTFSNLCNPRERREYGIELGLDRAKKLRAIQSVWQKKYDAVYHSPPTPQQQAKMDQVAEEARRQIETVFTPQEIEDYRRRQHLWNAGYVLMTINDEKRARNVFGITLTPDQTKKLDAIVDDVAKTKRPDVTEVDVLAVLTPQQQKLLRQEFERTVSDFDEKDWSEACRKGMEYTAEDVIEDEGSITASSMREVVPEAGKNAIPEQTSLSGESLSGMAKLLALSDRQQKALKGLDAQQQKSAEKFFREVLKLPVRQRSSPDILKKAAAMQELTRRGIQAILTPAQWAALHDEEARNWGHAELWKFALYDDGTEPMPALLRALAITDRQVASVRRPLVDRASADVRFFQEVGRKALEILTPEQKEKLRKHGWDY